MRMCMGGECSLSFKKKGFVFYLEVEQKGSPFSVESFVEPPLGMISSLLPLSFF